MRLHAPMPAPMMYFAGPVVRLKLKVSRIRLRSHLGLTIVALSRRLLMSAVSRVGAVIRLCPSSLILRG